MLREVFVLTHLFVGMKHLRKKDHEKPGAYSIAHGSHIFMYER
jgi:hypothetical protein